MNKNILDKLFDYQILEWKDLKKSKNIRHKIFIDWKYSKYQKKPRTLRGFGYWILWCSFLKTNKKVNPYIETDLPIYFRVPALTFTKALNRLKIEPLEDKRTIMTFKKISQQTLLIEKIRIEENISINPPTKLYDPDRIKKILDSSEFQKMQREYESRIR